MKKWLSGFLFLVLILSIFGFSMQGCAGPGASSGTVGNGKLDPVEAATINLAVGVIMGSHPTAIKPALEVSTNLLLFMNDPQQMVSLSLLDGVIAMETAKLGLDPLTLQSFKDLVVLVRAEIVNRLSVNTALPNTTKLILVKQFVQIVHDAAAARSVTGPVAKG